MIHFESEETMDGFIIILKASNGRKMATSIPYKNKKSAINAISTLIQNAPMALLDEQINEPIKTKYPKFEFYKNIDETYSYCLKKDKSRILIQSISYKSFKTCKKAALYIKNSLRIRQ